MEPPKWASAEAHTTLQVLSSLRRIIRAVDLHSRHLVQRFGLTGPQLVVLKELLDGEPMTVSLLARRVNLSQATTTGILDRLVRKGMAERVRSDEDRRKVIVTLTDAARATLEGAPPLLQEHFTERFAHLPDWEQSQVLSSLQRVVALMEAGDVDAGPFLTSGPLDVTSEAAAAYLASPTHPNADD